MSWLFASGGKVLELQLQHHHVITGKITVLPLQNLTAREAPYNQELSTPKQQLRTPELESGSRGN